MADLAPTSRFTSLGLSFDIIRGVIDYIQWVLDDTDDSRGYIVTISYPTSGQYLTDLGILQDIYESSDGFRDADGNAITPTVRGFPYGTTVESLDEFGSYNPLREDAYEQYQDSLRIQGAASRGVVKHEGSGDDERIEQTIGHIVVPKQAAGSTYDWPLRRWNTVERSSTQVQFSLSIDTDDNINSASKLSALPAVKAFLSYMESVRSGGSEVGTAVLENATWTSREFHIRQESSDTDDLELTWAGFRTVVGGNNRYELVQLRFFLTTSSEALNIVELAKTIIGETGTIQTSDALMIAPPVGHLDTPIVAREIDLGNEKALISRNNGLFYRGRNPHDARPNEVPLMSGTGFIYPFNSLRFINTKRQVSNDPFVLGAYFSENETADDIIQLMLPSNFVESPASVRELQLHNFNSDFNLDVHLWGSNDRIVTVYPNEHIRFLLSLEEEGAGKLVDLHLPIRVMEHSGDFAGTFASLAVFEDGSDLMRPVRFGTGQNAFIHPDAFNIHSGGRPSAVNQGEILDYTGSWEFTGAWTVELGGLMLVDYQYELGVGGVSANLSGENGPRLYRLRDGTLEAQGELLKTVLSGNGGRKTYSYNHPYRVQAGDLFFFMHVYESGSGYSEIRYENWARKVELFPEIQIVE